MGLICKNSTWFEAKVKIEKQTEDGGRKPCKEEYVVDALSFGEAEARVTEEVAPFASGEVNVEALKIAAFKEVFFDEEPTADKWYKVKIQLQEIIEDSDKIKYITFNYLVQAANASAATHNAEEIMKGTMADYAIQSIVETKIMDVYVYGDVDDLPKKQSLTVTAADEAKDELMEPVAGEDGFEPLG